MRPGNAPKSNPEFDPSTLPTDIDAVCDSDPTLSACVYLGRSDSDPANLSTSVDAVQKAFAYGYTCAIYRCRILSPVLLYPGYRSKERIGYIEQQVKGAYDDMLNNTWLLLAAADLHTSIHAYMLDPDEHFFKEEGGVSLKDVFTDGYKTAIICHGRYDRCLTMEGHMLRTEVLASIIAYRQSEENARAATARIIAKQFEINKTKFRNMLFDKSQVLDDTGNPVKITED